MSPSFPRAMDLSGSTENIILMPPLIISISQTTILPVLLSPREVAMPDQGSKYTSIEEVRSILYPRRPGLLNLNKEDVLEFPANLTGESRVGQHECGAVTGGPVTVQHP